MSLADNSVVVMGRIGAPFGVRGWVWILADTDTPDSLFNYPDWLIGGDKGWQTVKVTTLELRPNGLVAQLEGIDDRDQVSRLRGQYVAVPRAQLPPTGDDEYYWNDLIGLSVINREGQVLGTVDNLLESSANDILVVKGERERLIPFVAAIVDGVDLSERAIKVDWGLDY